MKNSTFDLYEIVTEKILADIEKNEKLTWVKPWKCNNGGCFPMNGKSKKPYNGINFSTAIFMVLLEFQQISRIIF